MPPRGGVKRKAASSKPTTNGTDASPAPPDRATWPGWVEMESEPAFFNVMLKDMGVRGIKVQEVYGMDDDTLMVLPQPIHALIFLFKYRDTDTIHQTTVECPREIWFANQIPDFACATFALLNIVNNIPGLTLGQELQRFKDFTINMDPLSKGDAVHNFDFVRRIHNSFASENDMLQADMYMKRKAEKLRKKRATAKAVETRKAKQKDVATPKTPLDEKSINATVTPTRTSSIKGQISKETPKGSSEAQSPQGDPDDNFKPGAKEKVNPSQREVGAKAKLEDEKPKANQGLRRSGRASKPRQIMPTTVSTEAKDDDGFHFIAYMPINGHVWKLDGLDRFPQDVGSIEDAGGNWMDIAQPALMGRMAQHEGSDLQYNLMAIVHDTIITDHQRLVANVKTLQVVDEKLDSVYDDWRAMENAETKKDVITPTSLGLGITLPDINRVEPDAAVKADVEKEEDLLKLIELRSSIIAKQTCLRAAVRDTVDAAKEDNEKARHRRHDYGTFARSWLGALADAEILSGLLDA